MVVQLSVADLSITLVAVLQFQHHFPPYPTSLQYYTQEVNILVKVVDFRDEGMWWHFTVITWYDSSELLTADFFLETSTP